MSDYDRDMDDLDDRGRGRGRGNGGPGGFGRFGPRRSKVCNFCLDKVKEVPYKDVDLLRRYLTDRGKIRPRRQTGTCAKHQRSLAVAVKRARHLALIPFTADHLRGE
jgi:small subunit ribosomal protein S18